MSLLVDYFAARESLLLATARVQASAGHPLNKGTPREHFIREFLQLHLGEKIAIGTGEVVCSNSKSGEPRNQHDIVLYKREYPKLDFGGGISAFLVESVISTVEVKSTLTKEDLRRAFVSAKCVKSLPRSVERVISAGYQPPSSLSLVVAYDGPASMNTVYGWLPDIQRPLGISQVRLGENRDERTKVPAPAINGVFVLGRGFLTFDNTPLSFLDNAACAKNPEMSWVYADMPTGGLLLFFLTLMKAISGFAAEWLAPVPYLEGLALPKRDLKGGPGV